MNNPETVHFFHSVFMFYSRLLSMRADATSFPPIHSTETTLQDHVTVAMSCKPYSIRSENTSLGPFRGVSYATNVSYAATQKMMEGIQVKKHEKK